MAWLKSFLPKSLYARTLVILMAPVLVAMVVTIYVFINHHLDSMTHRLADNIAGEISSLTEMYQSQAMGKEQLIEFAKEHYQISLSFRDEYNLRKKSESTIRAIGEWFLEESLNANLKLPFYVRLDRNTIYIDVLVNSDVLHFETSRKRLLSKTTPVYLLWAIVLPLFMFLIAAIFMKNQVKPLRRLARAADKFGKGLSVPPIKPEGSTEVRQAAMAFNRMQERIHRQISQRTEMLAGVSHDLRTPLTRMELELAMMEDIV
ncbi:MAG: HAMP domain-containing protein, partial [Alphaproteobacteria bacterium]|nr:HAMP domain-containing protein [Alphaproteobacteria bacterium]